jgi:HD-GYP domain-containing protein (c-di-GMP phosphodiesterase class II)
MGLNLPLFIILSILILSLIAYGIRQRTKCCQLEERMTMDNQLKEQFQPFQGMEKNLDRFLELVSQAYEAPTTAFYLLDPKSNHYVLKSIRLKVDSTGLVAPSYSGLVPFQREIYHPPIRLGGDPYPTEVSLIKEGEVPLIHIPVGFQAGFIRIGPVREVPKIALKRLSMFEHIFDKPIGILLEAEQLFAHAEALEITGKAMRNISQMAMNQDEMIKMMMNMMRKAFGLDGGFLAMRQESAFEVLICQGDFQQTDSWLSDPTLQMFLSKIAEKPTISIMRKGELVNLGMPARFAKAGEWFCFLPFHHRQGPGVLSFWVNQAWDPEEEKTLIAGLDTVSRHLLHLFDMQLAYGQTRPYMIEILKLLAQTIDQLSPYTVGYSEMMGRYSIMIAQEMGLPEQMIRDVGLAAFLSNIGVLGLSEGLFFKEGKYSEVEYEQMKLHAEVGASIIDITLAHSEVSSYIRYHHERMDGNGYPSGLAGNEIPLGARIIAVVQTFLAKINSRSYRQSLPFDQAIELLKAAAGTQLDPEVVAVFVDWFSRKQMRAKPNHPLGHGWEVHSQGDL